MIGNHEIKKLIGLSRSIIDSQLIFASKLAKGVFRIIIDTLLRSLEFTIKNFQFSEIKQG